MTEIGVAFVVALLGPACLLWLGRRIGKPNGGGSVVGEIVDARADVAELRGAFHEHQRSVDAQFVRGEERFDRLERGHEQLRDGQVEMTNAIAQTTAALERLNELHEREP